jgi:hypothetical protein
VEGFARSLARFLVAQLRHRRTTVVAQYELTLEAARDAALGGAARASAEAYAGLFQEMLAKIGAADPPGDARLLVALMDGLLLDHLSAPRSPLAADAFTDQLRRFLGGLLD